MERLSSTEQRRLEREAQKAKERTIRQFERAIDDIETEIQECERRRDELSLQISNPDIASDFARLAPLIEEHKQCAATLKDRMARWEKLHEELEQAGQE